MRELADKVRELLAEWVCLDEQSKRDLLFKELVHVLIHLHVVHDGEVKAQLHEGIKGEFFSCHMMGVK